MTHLAEAQAINAISDRQERVALIRATGRRLFDQHGKTSILRELMEACIEHSPERENQLLGEFNGALDGIGGWRS